jgi:hypothetical protein
MAALERSVWFGTNVADETNSVDSAEAEEVNKGPNR